MDLSDINKIANRKRMNAESEKLREKVSRETAKIIKLKVAQDTAYWDLKEKLQQVEGNHEKLQQNMVEVQMQYETISGQYQEELRLRPDTLNKVSSTREICGVLQEYSERLRETLARCAADQAALGNAYQRSGQLVRELRTRHAEDSARDRSLAAGLQEKVQLMTEHQNQLVQLVTAAKQQAEAERGELRRELTAASAHRHELLAQQRDLCTQLELCKLDAEKKEEMNTKLQSQLGKLTQEFSNQAAETGAAIADRDKQIEELKEENQSLRTAVENQDEFIKSMCEQRNMLQEQEAVLQEERGGLLATIDQLRANVEDASNLNLNLQANITSLNQDKEDLLQQVQDAQKVINNFEEQINNLQAERVQLENDKADVTSELNKAVEESNVRAMHVEKITGLNVELRDKVAELETTLKTLQETWDEKNKELNALIEAKDAELDSKAYTISQLMSELKTSSEIISKLEGALQKIKKEIEIERDAVKDKEKTMSATIGRLEAVVRDKDDEISKQLSMMLEMRSEKERLQEKIQSMQNTIDNIQKELTRPPPLAGPTVPHLQPELDDNAVMLTPTHKKTQLLQPPATTPSAPRPQQAQFAVPRAAEPDRDAALYSLFSDSSMEGDTLDVSEVNRRFNALARGEQLSPAPLSALKRRSSVPAAQGGLRHKPPQNNNDPQISLSQVKNEIKNKERSFFKNKRLEHKAKKAK